MQDAHFKELMKSQPDNCTPEELRDKRAAGEKFLLLDVRTAREHAIVRLDPCVHVPVQELEDSLDQLLPWRDHEIIVLCHHGIRSARAQACLRAHGFTRVRNLTGGIDAYAARADTTLPRYR